MLTPTRYTGHYTQLCMCVLHNWTYSSPSHNANVTDFLQSVNVITRLNSFVQSLTIVHLNFSCN
jgi:hypothetical protein